MTLYFLSIPSRLDTPDADIILLQEMYEYFISKEKQHPGTGYRILMDSGGLEFLK